VEGLKSFPEMISIQMNEAMRIERSKYLNANPYQRSHERSEYTNVYKPKTVRIRLDEAAIDNSQVEEGGFYSQALVKSLRSERAVTLSLEEMYMPGI
jgi:transposase-like protein